MSFNQHYKDDLMYATQITRNVLSVLGVWPYVNEEKSILKEVFKFLLILACWILLYCVLIPGTMFWVFEKKILIKIRMVPLLLFGFMAIGKYGNLLFRRKQIMHCLQHINEDWKNVISMDKRNIMTESAKTGRVLVMLCGAFMYGSGMIFRSILPLSRGKIVNAQNITIKPLPCPGYFFSIDVQVSPIYEMVFAMQFLSGLVTFSITTGVCGLTAVFVMHACGQLQILMALLENLVEEQWQNKKEVNKKLAEMVEHHTRIRSFLQLVEQTLQQMCLIELMGCTIIICIIGYCIIMEWENKQNTLAMFSYFLTLSSLLINVFMFCYTGEQLTVQAEKIAIASCELEWFRLPDKNAREMILVIIISNSPTKITAGKVMDLSLKTFGDVIKTSMTYFNMLRNMTY